MSDTGDIQDRINRRAHEIWEREGHPHGRHDEHWAQAEAEIRAEDAGKPAKPASTRKSGAKGTRAAAEDMSAVEAGDDAAAKSTPTKPKAPKAAPKAASAKPPRKDSGKSASAR